MKWNALKELYNKVSLNILRLEMLVMCGVVAICLYKAGGLLIL